MNHMFLKPLILKTFCFINLIFQKSTNEYLYLKKCINADFRNIFIYDKPILKNIGEVKPFPILKNQNGNKIDNFYLLVLSTKDVGAVNIF